MTEHGSDQQSGPVDVHGLTFTDAPVDDVPPPAGPDDVKVARSYRLPVELDQWVAQAAADKGIKPSALAPRPARTGSSRVPGR